MQKQYKSSENRLSEYFKQSRDQWKKRSTKNQTEKRNLTFKLRDVEQSRDKWKQDYRNLQKELDALKKKHLNI